MATFDELDSIPDYESSYDGLSTDMEEPLSVSSDISPMKSGYFGAPVWLEAKRDPMRVAAQVATARNRDLSYQTALMSLQDRREKIQKEADQMSRLKNVMGPIQEVLGNPDEDFNTKRQRLAYMQLQDPDLAADSVASKAFSNAEKMLTRPDWSVDPSTLGNTANIDMLDSDKNGILSPEETAVGRVSKLNQLNKERETGVTESKRAKEEQTKYIRDMRDKTFDALGRVNFTKQITINGEEMPNSGPPTFSSPTDAAAVKATIELYGNQSDKDQYSTLTPTAQLQLASNIMIHHKQMELESFNPTKPATATAPAPSRIKSLFTGRPK